MLTSLALTIAVAAAATQLPTWCHTRLLGWTVDGSYVVWEGQLCDEQEKPGGPAGNGYFRVVTDAQGRLARVFREGFEENQLVEAEVARYEPRHTSDVWTQSETRAVGAEWLKKHPLAGSRPENLAIDKPVEVGAGNDKVSIRVMFAGDGCKLVSLVASASASSVTLGEDRCLRGEPAYQGTRNWAELAWSPDHQRRAISWAVNRFTRAGPETGPESALRSYMAVVSRRSLSGAAPVVPVRRTVAVVDLLDAGAADALDAMKVELSGAGYLVAHQGKAGTPRAATEIFYAPGFEAEARDAAGILGVPDTSVKPLSWKSPYAITVAAAGKGPKRRRSVHGRRRRGGLGPPVI